MNTKSITLLTNLLVVATHPLHAAPRASANYSILSDTVDAGGSGTASTAYSNNSSIGSVSGISTASTPTATAKHGYIGQLYEVTALQLAASPATVDEGATRQLGGGQLLDDASILAVPAASIAWSVQGGPVSGISPAGLATAAMVYQNTDATAQGSFAGMTGILNLTVLDTIPDNFGTYAGDGLDDSWQFQYFGLNNPLAAPGLDPDGDGQTNRFEFAAGIVPTNPLSRFLLRIEPVIGQPGRKNLIYSPLVAGRNYEVKSSTTLAGAWQALSSVTTADTGDERTVTDLNASGTEKFYRVEITKP